MKSETKKGILAIFLSTWIFGTMGILIRIIAQEVTPFSQVMIRVMFATIIVLVFIILYKKEYLKITKKDIPFYATSGVFGYALMLILFTMAILKTSIANVYFLMSTEAIFSAVLASVFLHEKISKSLFLSIIICFVGVFLIFNPSNLTENILGNSLALLAGLMTAVYIIVNRRMGKIHGTYTNTLWAFVFAIIFLTPTTFLVENPLSLKISSFTWFWLVVFAVFNVLGYFLLNIGLKSTSAGYSGVILAFRPVSSAIYAFLFLHEIPSLMTGLGAVLITFSVVYLSLKESD
jgi:drug/metabolite transporter (DMT)-like permease